MADRLISVGDLPGIEASPDSVLSAARALQGSISDFARASTSAQRAWNGIGSVLDSPGATDSLPLALHPLTDRTTALTQFSASVVSAPATNNPDSGNAWGTFVANSAINPGNWTRSTSRTGYIDPYTYRSNLVVLTGYMVSKINFDTSNKDSVKATSVDFMKKRGGKVHQVKAKREVILSAGSVNDPQILERTRSPDVQ